MYSQLALQTQFHGPLAYPPPYPPRPIFQRVRPPELSAAETGTLDVQYETSFYKNTYAMVGPSSVYLPFGLTRLPVCGCDDIPSALLLSRYQAQYHSLHIDSVGGVGSSVVCAHSACSPDAAVRSSARDMAGECCCGGTVLPGYLGVVAERGCNSVAALWRGCGKWFMNPRLVLTRLDLLPLHPRQLCGTAVESVNLPFASYTACIDTRASLLSLSCSLTLTTSSSVPLVPLSVAALDCTLSQIHPHRHGRSQVTRAASRRRRRRLIGH